MKKLSSLVLAVVVSAVPVVALAQMAPAPGHHSMGHTGAMRHPTPAPNTMAPAPNAMHPAPNTMAPAPNAMHPAPNAMAPNAMRPAPNNMAPAH